MKPSAFSTSLACASAAPNNATRTAGSAPAPAAAAAAICCVPPVIEWYTIKRVAIHELSQKAPVGYVLQAAATPSDCISGSLPGDSQHPQDMRPVPGGAKCFIMPLSSSSSL